MTFLVEWAYDNGRLPSEALELYETHPRDFKLLMAMRIYRAEREKAALEEEQKKAKQAQSRNSTRRSV